MGTRQTVGLTNHRHWLEGDTIDGNRVAGLKTDFDLLSRIGGVRHRCGHGEDLLGRGHHRILKGTGFNTSPQEIEVDRIRRFLAHRSRDATAFAVGNRLLPTHPPLASRSQHLQIRRKGCDCHIETHLVIALARAAMGHGVGAHLTGHLHQASGNQRPSQGGGQGIAPLVKGVGPNRREGELLNERLNQITHQRLTGSSIKSLLTNRLQLIALTEISREGDHLLHSPLLLQVGDADTGIHPTGVSENHLVGAAHQRVS